MERRKYIIDQELESFRNYRKVIDDIIESRKYQSGSDQYGGLMIDVPKLMNEIRRLSWWKINLSS